MKKNILSIAVQYGLLLGFIVAFSTFIHSSLRDNMYTGLIHLWVIYVFAALSCFFLSFSSANKKNQFNFLSAILLVGIIASLAAIINGLEAYIFTQFFDPTYLSEMLMEEKENWKAYNYTETSEPTQWVQRLYKDPISHGTETTKTMFVSNSVLGSFAFVIYFIRWMLKNSKKLRKRKG